MTLSAHTQRGSPFQPPFQSLSIGSHAEIPHLRAVNFTPIAVVSDHAKFYDQGIKHQAEFQLERLKEIPK